MENCDAKYNALKNQDNFNSLPCVAGGVKIGSMKELSDFSPMYVNEQYELISNNGKRYRLSKNQTQEYAALSMGFTTAD